MMYRFVCTYWLFVSMSIVAQEGSFSSLSSRYFCWCIARSKRVADHEYMHNTLDLKLECFIPTENKN